MSEVRMERKMNLIVEKCRNHEMDEENKKVNDVNYDISFPTDKKA
jgi:hypothetical protein